MKRVFIWTVKAHGIQVVKLLYLGRKEFRVLKELRDRFVGRLPGERQGLGEAKTPLHSENHLFISPLRDVLSPGIVNPSSDFEPTNASTVFDSLFWRWRRTREYFRDLLGMDHAKEVYELM